MNTREIMDVALDLVGFTEVPPDSGIYVEGEGIKRVIMGIEMGPAELLLAQKLGYDCVISHHPQGGDSRLSFWQIIEKQVALMRGAGVPKKVAEAAVAARRESLEVTHHTADYDHAPSLARLLKMPYLGIHNPLDEMGRRIMQEKIDALLVRKPDATVGQVVEALKEIGEFKKAATEIKIRHGAPKNPAGKTLVFHAAGTNGGFPVARALFQYGVATVVYIHIAYADLVKIRSLPTGNLIVTGHIASDSVGINPFLGELERPAGGGQAPARRRRGLKVQRVGIIQP